MWANAFVGLDGVLKALFILAAVGAATLVGGTLYGLWLVLSALVP